MRGKSIAALLVKAKEQLAKIESEYNACLKQKNIKDELKIDIKNLLENLRSVLDYLAHDIRETHCPTAKKDARFYFPILPDAPTFVRQVNQWFPGLQTAKPDLWEYLESVQPYKKKDNAWFGTFNQLNNENKHQDLVEQTRKETNQIRVTTQNGGQVAWNPENVKFGPGVYIGGVPVDPRTQLPIAHENQKIERIIWVDFLFHGLDVSAIGLLRQSFECIDQIAKAVRQHL